MLLILRTLYELKSSGASCRANLADTLNSMCYRSTKFYPDVWIKKTKVENGNAYYK